MPLAGFEPTIPATKRSIYELDRAATGIGNLYSLPVIIKLIK
jgi:hypothetical protein